MNHSTKIFCLLVGVLTGSARAQATIELGPGDDLPSKIRQAQAGTTFRLRDGTYAVTGTLQIVADGITLTSKSGSREAVILDGNSGGGPPSRENFLSEIIQVRSSNVTISDITIRHAAAHGIHASGGSETIRHLVVRNVHILDCGEQFIKVNSNGDPNHLTWVDSGLVEHSLLEFQNTSVMHDMGTYDYTGGIDIHGGRDWIIRSNEFRNFWRDDRLQEHAIHFWSRSRGSLIENNTFINCWRAVGLGMKTQAEGLTRSYPDGAGESPYFDHVDGIVRNNVVYNDASHRLESGVELANVTGAQIYHNTIFSRTSPFNSIEYRWPNTRVAIKNNLCSHRIMERDGAQAELATNLTSATATLFVDPDSENLHLLPTASSAIHQATPLDNGLAGQAMDGFVIVSPADIGADQQGKGVNLSPWRRPRNPAALGPSFTGTIIEFDGLDALGRRH
ncbi:MAG TPA: right-handed parallel beta-helix repeat-containing protein [Fibrobacteria bacterium]|nr:right-handed parallel beta-helix repeat-containing protein [Fibrobacteria bacterium]